MPTQPTEHAAPDTTAVTPPARAQLSAGRLVRMSVLALRHHVVGSLLQVATIAATAAFLAFVLSQLALERAAPALGLQTGAEHGRLAQLVWMLAVALLVCTVSNVTSMLLSVTKRFREIGTMKCLGAFDTSILHLFLIEAMILGGAGAAAGALLGVGAALLAGLAAHGTHVLNAALLGPFAAAAGITVSTVAILSFAGAAYPAWVASRMMPIEAMRSV